MSIPTTFRYHLTVPGEAPLCSTSTTAMVDLRRCYARWPMHRLPGSVIRRLIRCSPMFHIQSMAGYQPLRAILDQMIMSKTWTIITMNIINVFNTLSILSYFIPIYCQHRHDLYRLRRSWVPWHDSTAHRCALPTRQKPVATMQSSWRSSWGQCLVKPWEIRGNKWLARDPFYWF